MSDSFEEQAQRPEFEHIRYKPATQLTQPRPLVIVCSPLRSNVNLSTIVRTAGCCGVNEVIATGTAKVNSKIARDGAENVKLTVRRSILPVLKKLKSEGFCLVGLEQTTNSSVLGTFPFPHKCALIVGAEREGLSQECLNQLDSVVEIPMWGLPYSYNVATATSMCMLNYCMQYPHG